ncbi:MucBP domain-containing protein [Enterococcus sp. LJL98]
MQKKSKSIYPWLACGLLLMHSFSVPVGVLADENHYEQTFETSQVNETQDFRKAENEESAVMPYRLTQLSVGAVASSVYAGEAVPFNVHYQNAVTNEEQTAQNQVLVLYLLGFSEGSLAKIDVDQLKILGVTPKQEENKLIYSLESLKKGETFQTTLYLPTENGVSPSGTKVSIKAEMKNQGTGESLLSESSQTEILSDSTLAVSTKYGETIGASEPIAAPRVGDETQWEFNVHVPKRASGVKYLKEGEKLKITYTLKGDAVFQRVMGETPEPTTVSENGKVLQWEIDNPTLLEQEAATDVLFARAFQLNVRINDDAEVFSKLTGEVLVSAAFIDGTHDSKSYAATVSITRSEKTDPPYLEGSVYGAYWYGPSDGKGATHSDLSDANPTVYQDALLGWRMYNGVGHALNIHRDPDVLELHFDFDGNQEFKQFYAYPAIYKPGLAEEQPLTSQPRYHLKVTFDDQTSLTLIEDVQPNQMYDFTQTPYKEQLKGKTIKRVTLDYSKIPAGMLNRPGFFFYTTPKTGYVGEVTIQPSMHVKGVGNSVGLGSVDFTYTDEGVYDNEEQKFYSQSDAWKKILSKRSAKVVEYGEDAPRIFAQNIELNQNNQVKLGENEVTVTLNNLKTSLAGMKGTFESYVLLPYGLTYLDGEGEDYQTEVVTDRYQGTQQTLVKIRYQSKNLGIAKKLKAQFKVQADKKMLTTSRFELYTMIDSTEKISVPESVDETIFDLATTIIEDQNDLNNNGKKDEKVYASARSTTYSGNHSFALDLESGFEHFDAQRLVKSSKDTTLNYQIKLNDTSDESLENLIVMGMLPQVDDYGLVTLEERQSKYMLSLTGPIQFKNQEEKFDVYYSKESQIQTVGELDVHTKYAESFEPLKNHAKAVSPDWIEEKAVQNWTEIQSFKIVQKKGEILDRQSLLINLPLKTPKDLSLALQDTTIPAAQRAAYMNIAAAANNYMPIENLKTGVFIDVVKGEAITVRYEDESGQSLAPAEKLTGNVGETYETKQKNIEGYTFQSVQGPVSGTFTSKAQTVTYIYTKMVEAGEAITVRYEDGSGQSLAPAEKLTGNVGEPYETKQKNIEGYTFQSVQGPVSGTFTSKAQTVTYIYTKMVEAGEAITVRYEDETGQSLAPAEKLTGNVGETYETKQKNIEGYTFQSVQGPVSGTFTSKAQTVIYLYQKDVPKGNADVKKPTGKLPKTGGSTGRLPQTNEATEPFLLILGILLLLFVFLVRKRQEKSHK